MQLPNSVSTVPLHLFNGGAVQNSIIAADTAATRASVIQSRFAMWAANLPQRTTQSNGLENH
jgi:hypothetical protein